MKTRYFREPEIKEGQLNLQLKNCKRVQEVKEKVSDLQKDIDFFKAEIQELTQIKEKIEADKFNKDWTQEWWYCNNIEGFPKPFFESPQQMTYSEVPDNDFMTGIRCGSGRTELKWNKEYAILRLNKAIKDYEQMLIDTNKKLNRIAKKEEIVIKSESPNQFSISVKTVENREEKIKECLEQLKNPYVYFWNPRNWRKEEGITEDEIRKRYTNPELNVLCFLVGEDKNLKSEQFPYVEYREIEALIVLSKLKYPVEKIVQLILSHKDAGIREMIKHEKKNLEDYKKTAFEYSGKDSEYAQNWIEHSERAFEEICIMCKWIGIEPPKEI